jgi:hypothetical protein
MQDAIRKGSKTVWLKTNVKTDYGLAMRINYYNPGTVWWGGSSPVERRGLFGYQTYVNVGGRPENKELNEDGVTWVSKCLLQ